MPICDKNIIDCLRDRGVNPTAIESELGYQGSVASPASNAINYSTTANYESGTSAGQWWMIDFKQIVNIDTYQIFTYPGMEINCDWIIKWKVLASLRNSKWRVIDEPAEGHPNGANYTLKQSVNARYLKIENVNPNSCLNKMVFRYINFYGALNPMQLCPSFVRKHEISHNIIMFIALAYS